jgi:selenide, water dikinase
LRGLPPIDDPNVLVATATADDAGVYKINDETALVQTVDFFTPIVDDPYTFGAIAAANALSDVYAMGGRPITALAIAAFPEEMDPNVIASVLRGGAEKAREAGVTVIGGHTIKDDEPKYGLAVTGVVHPERIQRNATPQPGDALILTKPLGTGILTTARRSDRIEEPALREAIASMLTLNRGAADAIGGLAVHAMTDVTGYGLLGHLREMLVPTESGAELDASAIPLFAGALELARAGVAPGGTRNNLQQAIDAGATFDDSIEEAMRLLLADAQTSGGLLIAIAPQDAQRYLDRVRLARRIGTVRPSGPIRVRAS